MKAACDYFRSAYRLPASKLLPYGSLVVPFAGFFNDHPDKPDGRQAAWLRELFWRISLTGRYTSAVENKVAQDYRKVLAIARGEEPQYDPSFGVDVSPDAIKQNGFFRSSRSFVKPILCLLAYQQPRSFDDDGVVHIANDWLKKANSKNYHHFFPKKVLRQAGYDPRQINHIANITIVDDFLNKRKIKTRWPSDYMREFEKHNNNLESTMATHLIDLDDGVWNDDYDRFFEARCEHISKKLAANIKHRPIDDARLAMTDEDIDPDAEHEDELDDLELESTEGSR